MNMQPIWETSGETENKVSMICQDLCIRNLAFILILPHKFRNLIIPTTSFFRLPHSEFGLANATPRPSPHSSVL